MFRLNLLFPVKKQPILLPTRKVLRSIARSTQHSPQSSRLQLTAPIPPTRTTSVKPTYDEVLKSYRCTFVFFTKVVASSDSRV